MPKGQVFASNSKGFCSFDQSAMEGGRIAFSEGDAMKRNGFKKAALAALFLMTCENALIAEDNRAVNVACPLAGGPAFGSAMGRPSCPSLDFAVRLCGTIYNSATALGGDPANPSIKIWPQNLTLNALDVDTQTTFSTLGWRLGCVYGDKLPSQDEAFAVKKIEFVNH
jgi:hypothetical protein